jgi:hypothetical protein
MSRVNKELYTRIALAADSDISLAKEIVIGETGHVAFQVLIDNGAGAAPSDTPAGVWELWCNALGSAGRFTQYVDPIILAPALARIAPNGNQLVDQWAVISGVPGAHCKLRYNNTSGGAGNSRATVYYSTW